MNKKPLYLKQILNFIKRRSSVINKKEIVNLLEAEDKILAENIYSKISLPPFKNSAVDGYALLKKDLNKIIILNILFFIIHPHFHFPHLILN